MFHCLRSIPIAFRPSNLEAFKYTKIYATNFGVGLTSGAESQVIAAVFKTLISRFVESFKELKSQENIALYCDVRQLVTYVKGAHGGPFRLAALSGIMAVTQRPHKKAANMQTTRVIRYFRRAIIKFLV